MKKNHLKLLEALNFSLSSKKADRTPLIEDDTHREWISNLHSSNKRFKGGVELEDKDAKKLETLHQHYLGNG
jgi:hypothetical protein